MNLTRRTRTWFGIAALLASFLLITSSCFAEGSIAWTDAQAKIAKDDPFLADYLAKTFEIRPSGGALRVGHDKDGNSLAPGAEVGERIPPYEFLAKPIGATGDFTLLLSLEPGSFADPKTTLWILTIRKRLPTD